MQQRTESDVYYGGVRSKAERWRLGHSGRYDAVKEDGITVAVCQYVDAEEEAAMSGEVVVDSETTLVRERVARVRLYTT